MTKAKSRATLEKIRALADPARNPNPYQRAVAAKKLTELKPKAPTPKPRGENLLSARTVASAKDGWHSDGNRLYLRVDGERRRWICKVTRSGRKREYGLGSVDTTSLALARQKRDKLLEQLRQGLDPVAVKEKEREAEREEREARKRRKSFAQIAREVIAKQESGWRTASDGRQSSLVDWTRSLIRDCAPINRKPVAEIATKDVVRVLQPLWDAGKHATARRLVTRIAMVMDYATANGLRTGDNPASWKIVQHIIPQQPNGRTKGHAALNWRDVPAFMAKLRQIDTASARCVEFAVLTASRSGEARGARWSEVDFGTATWTLPPERMKAQEEHQVPLSRQALDLLRRMEAARSGDLIFPGPERGRQLDISRCLDVVKAIKPDVTLHGFRSAFRSWCGDHGVERELAEQSLAHAFGSQVEQAYNRTAMLERRRPVMAAWGAFVSGEADADKVVPLKRGKRP
jgi:integrase